MDSIKVGIVQTGKEIIFSGAYFVDENNRTRIMGTYSSDFASGCSGCQMEPDETIITIKDGNLIISF
ncbi:MAG: hypothetical protein KKG93_01575 [Bacteroidetes bacterium]|nr:hypothetical protein [Bacteroidota bacterium]